MFNKMKTVCWITPSYFLDTDIYVMRYLPSFYNINWIITKRKGDQLDYLSLIDEIGKKGNINIEICEWYGKISSLRNLLFSYRLQKKANNADLIYQPSSFPYTLPLVMAFGNRKKIVVPVHNVHTPKGGSRYYINIIYSQLTLKYFRNFVTFSKSQYNLLKNIRKSANVLCTSFMLKDFGKCTRERENDLITFLSWGNIRRYKRIDVLIDAAQMVFEKTKLRFRVIIAGSCNEWYVYQSRIKYPDLFDLRIKRVDDSEIPNLFEECDYFVTPYQDIAQSGSLIVALNYNKPIIASKLEAFEDYVEDGVNGFLIQPANIGDLVNVMESVLRKHQSIYKVLQDKQRKMIAEKFDDKIVVDGYVKYINNLIQ